MECPFCGKIESGVIDSRLTPEKTAIRRRRKCSACAGRFTTYESTPEHFLFLLMKQHTLKGPSMRSPEAALAFISTAFKGLSEGIEKLVVKGDKPKPARKTKKPRKKVVAKAKPRKRPPVRMQGAMHEDGFIDDEEVADLQRQGAIGEMICHAFDIDGVMLPSSLAARVTTPPLAQAPQRPVIALSGGSKKADAVRAALRGGWLTGLVTDETCARHALQD